MSWAEEMGMDGWDEPYVSDTPFDVWEDLHHKETPIAELETSHLENIVKGIRAGKPYWSQDEKLPTLLAELDKRKEADNAK